MGSYPSKVQKLAVELAGAITESLGLDPNYLREKMEEGMQVVTMNCYPPCPQPHLTLGLPPHSDYSCLTILLQVSLGLEVMDKQDGGGPWKLVPNINGALIVHIGEHSEVLSKRSYKSAVHRAIVNSQKTRMSIASLHSLGLDEKEPAFELIDEDHPKAYKGSRFRDFLDFLSASSGCIHVHGLKHRL